MSDEKNGSKDAKSNDGGAAEYDKNAPLTQEEEDIINDRP